LLVQEISHSQRAVTSFW